ncbi:ATP synthase subunit s, mitochondrial [Drosophila innubila]|uniref:ATP synthase subunit s, mitochondrial n=1 Tax=Drosophila innubila TaxID=198719 RepID=UPI00148C5E28|nr:ATP synthase subunit s, mitochondrial [Drosophila innubila]
MALLNTISRSMSMSKCLVQGAVYNVHKNYVVCAPPVRKIWGYVAVAFNQVDADRLAKVGPNRLCAEWVIKNGGGVRLTDYPSKLWKDYNLLPSEGTKFHIKVVDASNASVMKIGLEHFKGCTKIDTVIFHNCKHLEGDGLVGLTHLRDSLTTLQISGCYNMYDNDLDVIGELSNLKQLIIFDMNYVQNMDQVAANLRARLPNCEMLFNKQ